MTSEKNGLRRRLNGTSKIEVLVFFYENKTCLEASDKITKPQEMEGFAKLRRRCILVKKIFLVYLTLISLIITVLAKIQGFMLMNPVI